MIKRILLGLCGTSYTEAAVRKAIQLAEIHDATITAVTVVDIARLTNVGPVPIGGSAAADELRQHRINVTREKIEQAIGDFERKCQAANVNHQIRREVGNPFELLSSLARYHDMMVFGLRSVFEYDVTGLPNADPDSILMPLVSSVARPILAVSKELREFRNVMVAYAGSSEAANTMRQFVQSRPWPDVTLRIVGFGNDQSKCEKTLDDAADYCSAHGFEVSTRFVQGYASTQLLPEAESWDADLIVMGSSARNILMRKLFGETTRHVIKNAERPIYLSQ